MKLVQHVGVCALSASLLVVTAAAGAHLIVAAGPLGGEGSYTCSDDGLAASEGIAADIETWATISSVEPFSDCLDSGFAGVQFYSRASVKQLELIVIAEGCRKTTLKDPPVGGVSRKYLCVRADGRFLVGIYRESPIDGGTWLTGGLAEPLQ